MPVDDGSSGEHQSCNPRSHINSNRGKKIMNPEQIEMMMFALYGILVLVAIIAWNVI